MVRSMCLLTTGLVIATAAQSNVGADAIDDVTLLQLHSRAEQLVRSTQPVGEPLEEEDEVPYEVHDDSLEPRPQDIDEDELPEHCSLGEASDCEELRIDAQLWNEDEDDVVDEAGAVVKELGVQLPQELIQLQNGLSNDTSFQLLQLYGGGATNISDLVTSDDEIFGGFKVHIGPLTIDTTQSNPFQVSPQMKFGMESDSFSFVAGCDDIRNGVKCHATAEVKQSCSMSGSSISGFFKSTKCGNSEVVPAGKVAEVSNKIIAMLLDEVGLNGKGSLTLSGKVTIAHGAGIMGGVALGLWEDADGYKMVGGGMTGLSKALSGEFYVGIHKSGHKGKFTVAMGPGTVEATFDASNKKSDVHKANRIQGGAPVSSGPAKQFQPIGYGYGRGPGGTRTNTYCKMYVSFQDCMTQCSGDSSCIGFDAETKFDDHWQQCCIRTNSYRSVSGWHSSSGSATSMTTATSSTRQNRLVMARNQFYRIGSGYGRGSGGKLTNTYCKMQVTFSSCKSQCKSDDSCTGFDAEINHAGYWQQCCCRTVAASGPYGWHFTAGDAQPVMTSTTPGNGHNRAVYKKAIGMR